MDTDDVTAVSHPNNNEESPCQHVNLSFNLRLNRKALNEENKEILFNLYPHTKGVVFGGFYLLFCVGALPPRPWPITVAGLPAYFTLDPNDDGPLPPVKRASKSQVRIADDINARDLASGLIDGVFVLVRDFFSESQIPVTEIQYWGNFLVIVFGRQDVDLTKVPRWICRCPCYYLYENEMGRPFLETLFATGNRGPSGEVVERTSTDSKIGDRLYINTPSCGLIEGTCGPASIVRLRSSDSEPSHEWVRAQWAYMGQGSKDRLESVEARSAVTTDDEKVIGVFCYAPSSGQFEDWCMFTASDLSC